MKWVPPDPVESELDLRRRVGRLFEGDRPQRADERQYSLELPLAQDEAASSHVPGRNIRKFIDFMTCAVPDGDVYLFGGLLRDVALFGGRGFSSDVDLVVDGGDWQHLSSYLSGQGALRNKFGGYRLWVEDWPVDIWNARDTWAIKEGFVTYKGISSLTETTILNWDSVLMNWRTGRVIFRDGYLDQLQRRILDIVLEPNPNPKGMAVRVLRHLCSKDAAGLSFRAIRYLSRSASVYSFDELKAAELKSYGRGAIEYRVYDFFKHLDLNQGCDVQEEWHSLIATKANELDFGSSTL